MNTRPCGHRLTDAYPCCVTPEPMTVAELARELCMQPYGLLAFGDLGIMTDDAVLPTKTVTMIRDAFKMASRTRETGAFSQDGYWTD